MFRISSILLTVALACYVPAARADTLQFANFTQDGSNTPFQFFNFGTTGQFNSPAQGVAGIFSFSAWLGLPTGDQAAILTMDTTASGPATSVNGIISQPLGGVIQIARASDAANLLTVGFSGFLTGAEGATSFPITANTDLGDTIVYVSDFIDFSVYPAPYAALNLSFTGATSGLAIGDGGFLQTFNANDPLDFSVNAPEPSMLWPIAAGLFLAGVARTIRSRRRLARDGCGAGC